MEIRRRSETPTLMTPLRVWLFAGGLAVLLTAVVVNVWLLPVQAKVLLPRPVSTLPPSAPAAVKTVTPQTLQAAQSQARAAEHKALLRGIASWYGGIFNGQKTANGETYDQNAMTACHPWLPFGSLVKVVNLRNGKSVIVRITDRSALIGGRVLDLSYGAAEKLAMTHAGTAPVVLEVLSKGGSHAKPNTNASNSTNSNTNSTASSN